MDTTSPTSSKRHLSAYEGFVARGYRGPGVMMALAVTVWIGAMPIGLNQAFAQTASPPSTSVNYSDLDLSTTTGAHALLVRIDHAANAACGDLTHSPLLPREGAYHRACVKDAVTKAVNEVKAPMLARRHNDGQGDVTLAAR
jgi:UrcA family protein